MIVVSDTSPICYLLLIGEVELLPQLYTQVCIPSIVQQELSDVRSPVLVQNWINHPPAWLAVKTIERSSDSTLDVLDRGEQAAILLAEQHRASLIIIDDLLGRQMAQSRGLNITGLLGVLDEAAKQNLVHFPEAMSRLQQTTFRASPTLIQVLLERHQSTECYSDE